MFLRNSQPNIIQNQNAIKTNSNSHLKKIPTKIIKMNQMNDSELIMQIRCLSTETVYEHYTQQNLSKKPESLAKS